MNPVAKALWMEALEGDEFEQGTGALMTYDDGIDGGPQYCCLGVLCEIARKEGVSVEFSKEGMYGHYDGNASELPPKVQEWAGLDMDGKLPTPVSYVADGYQTQARSLVAMNDGMGATFKEIAKVIREQF